MDSETGGASRACNVLGMRAALVACLLAAAGGGVARAGSELPRHAGLYPKQGAALAMVASDVDVVVHGAIVEVTVTQTFRNDSDRATEATYIFPLPADAAVSAMAMTLGARTIHAAIATRADARKRYEDAVSAGVGATVLEQERPDVFTQTVSAIPPRGTVAVTLRYDAVAGYHDGAWLLAVPLVVAPRYVPGTASGQPTTGAGSRPDTDRSPDASRVTPPAGQDAGGPTRVVVHFADAVDDVTSPTHQLSAKGGAYALTDAHSDHDAVIRWRSHEPARGWSESGASSADGGYAAVLVEAPVAKARAATAAKLDVTLVLDRGAASLGDADAVGHPLVRALAGALGAHDSLAVAGSDHVARQGAAGALADLERAWAHPAGAFDLTAVLKDLRGHRDGLGAVVLVTGGLVSDDAAAIAAATALGVPIHVIGVGSAPNRALLAAIAQASGGTVRIASPDDDLAALAKDALADAAAPPAVLTVNWGALTASDVVPASLPRLGAGQARLVVARVKAARTANARAAGDVFAIAELPAETAVPGETSALGPLARRWARDRLGEMLAAASPDAKAIEAFALRYGLVSPYTSMIAVGDEVVETGGVKHSVSVPVSVPAGMRWQAVDAQDRVQLEKNKTDDEPEQESDRRKAEHAHAHDGRGGDGDDDDAADTKQKRREATSGKKLDKPDLSKDNGDDAGAADASSAAQGAPPPMESPETLEVAAVERTKDAEEVLVVTSAGSSVESGGRRTTVVASLAGGLAVTRDNVDALGTLTVGVDHAVGRRGALGVEGALWLAGGDLQGQLLVEGLRSVPQLLIGAGLGLHLGDGTGPVAELSLHAPLAHRFGIVLRTDLSLLFENDASHLDVDFTLGLEWRW